MAQRESKRAKDAAQEKSYRVLRRVHVSVKRFQQYGIERGDTAIIAMTGEVRIGELGYFETRDSRSHPYKQFLFVTEQDKDCELWKDAETSPGGICLRGFKQSCWGIHDDAAFGRVVAILRKGREVKTKITFRPYDECEGPATTRLEESPRANVDTTAKRLRAVYEPDGKYMGGNLNRISRRLNKLAEKAGIERPGATPYSERHTLYTLAVERGLGDSPEARELRAELDRVAAWRVDFELRTGKKEEKREPQNDRSRTYRVALAPGDGGAENIGYIEGETLHCEEAAAFLKVGDAAVAWENDDDDAEVGRVIAADADTFTIRAARQNGEYRETTFTRAACAWAGRVTGTTSGLEPEQEELLTKLRSRLAGVDADDITNSTSLLKIEREIYDIEHPPTGLNDWSEWEEE
jgi:hypothetical protein